MKKLIIYNDDFKNVLNNINRDRLIYLLNYYAPDVERVKAYYIYSNSRKSLKYIDIYEIGHKSLKYRIDTSDNIITKYDKKRILYKYDFN